MLVDIVEDPVGSGTWSFVTTDGAKAYTNIVLGIFPMEARGSGQNIKAIIKLKREGFTAEEIGELFEAGVIK